MKLLLEHGGLFKPSHKGTTVLHVACKKGFFEIVKFLLFDCKEQRIPIDCPKANGMTPLMLSVQHDQLFILRILKDAGANLQRTNDLQGAGKINLLYIACQFGRLQIVGYLIDKGIMRDVNQTFNLNE